ncbi:MAG: MFS transporter, partial [Candidatus Firestonebacteria bacterium]
MFLLDELQNIATGIIDEPLKFLNYHIGKTIKAVREMKGNAWVMIWTTFFWSIPGAWIGVYSNLYMKDLGVTNIEVGLISTLTIFTQMLTILLGGYLSDRYGRKRVLIIVDIATWIPSMLLLIFAQNVWYFMLSVVIRNLGMMANPAWKCLCLEDVRQEQRGQVFSIMALVGSVSGLSGPLGGILVGYLGIVPAVR